MKPSGTILHLQKVAGISGSEAHLLSLLPALRQRGWDVRMLMLHENEPGAWDYARALEARGVPLAGLSVKVTNGYFLIGLSAVDVDVQRNVSLLKERDWFDIPIVYTSGKRGILALEKGTPGQRAFQEAFRAWGE